jgi:acyl dehydratase
MRRHALWQSRLIVLDREKYLGMSSEPRTIDVERGFLKFFAKATGETNPIHFDEAAARAAGHRDIVAPPTYLFTLHMGTPSQRADLFDVENGLGLDTSRILHGEQSFTFHRPIYAGDRVTLTSTITDIYDKKGGALELVVQETRGVNAEGDLLAEMRNVTVVRNG